MWYKTGYLQLLILIMLLKTLTLKAYTSEMENITFVVTDRYCITNDISAISFNPSIEYTHDKAFVSDFYPKPSHPYKLSIDCNIDVGEDCTTQYYSDEQIGQLQNSIDGNINQGITDRRWEELELHKTEYNEERLEYKEVFNLNSSREDFVIAFSVRIEKEGHVYLCEGHVTQSTCYWIMLSAWKGKGTAIRKCSAGFISTDPEDWPKKPCSTPLIRFNHTDSILSSGTWNHFEIISKRKSHIIVKENGNQILHAPIKESFSLQKIFFHSKIVNGLWKLHKYNYIYHTIEGPHQLFPSTFGLVAGFTYCIALFVVMCTNCAIYIGIQNINTGDGIYESEIFTTPDGKWKEMKVTFTVPTNVTARIWVHKSFVRKDQQTFWAIDSIRQCLDNEYRLLESPSPDTPCQMIANQKSIQVKTTDSTDLRLNCPEHTFGRKCIPCTIFGGTWCDKFKYCEIVNDRKMCQCSSGFMNKYCSEECEQFAYGQGCENRCKFCLIGCHNINGICTDGKCVSDDFRGPKCDIPPGPLLKYPPKVISVSPTSCEIQVDNFEILGNVIPQYFKIQYQKTPVRNENSNDWENVKGQYIFNQYQSITIDNLEADTYYSVRLIPYLNPYDTYEGIFVEKSYFKTNCTTYQEKDIHFSPSNTSVHISITKSSNKMCRITNYKYRISGYATENIAGAEFEFDKLEPDTSYTFELWDDTHGTITRTFKTKEGEPSEVQNLEVIVTNSASNEIYVKWDKPKEPNGDVKYYIECTLIKLKYCNSEENERSCSHNDMKQTQIVLKNQQPAATYEVSVCAETKWGRGKCSSKRVQTNNAANLTKNEIPSMETKDIDSSRITAFLKPLNCDHIQGNIFLKFVAICQNEWCSGEPPRFATYDYSRDIVRYLTNGLYPYTNYTFIMYVSRDKKSWIEGTRQTFTTFYSVPNAIKKFHVISKDENSISFRWKPPYPPTGILAKYKIQYDNKFLEHDIETCKLWPEYHCATISDGISKGRNYYVMIWARNDNPTNYTEVLPMKYRVLALSTEPDRPYDVTTSWTENGNLNVSWKHPNATNGRLIKFEIEVKTLDRKGRGKETEEKKPNEKEINSENDYNLTYYQQIDRSYFEEPCSKYEVNVISKNKYYESKPETRQIMSPPPNFPYNINDVTKTRCKNNTMHVIIRNTQFSDNYFNKGSRRLYVLVPSPLHKNYLNEVNVFEQNLKASSKPTDLDHFHILSMNQSDTKITIDNNILHCDTNLSSKKYNLYLIFANECIGKIRIMRIKRKFPTNSTDEYDNSTNDSNKGLYALILLLLLVPLLAYLYIYKIKKKNPSGGRLIPVLRQRNKTIDEVPLKENETPSIVKPPIRQRKTPGSIRSTSIILKTNHSKPIRVADFELYVKRSLETGELQQQHEKFPRGQTKPWDYGALKINKAKNRYNNLIAYDHTRVILSKVNGIEHSDYINANYINGYRVPNAYIATQGPKSITLNDFWRMIWQENVNTIVMLANIYEGGKKKVEKYWPSINEDKDFDGILVQYTSSKVYANYEHRTFKVSKGGETREVNQLHFTSWPDHGVPLYSQSLVPFLQQILKIPNNTNSPVVVHCSAGVGRTGTIILCDICLRMAAGEGSVDFLANLERLRSQRPNMVDNVEQYKLAHLVVLECLFGMNTAITCDDNMNQNIERLFEGNAIANQLKYLSETEWQDRAMDTVWQNEEIHVYPEKNRFPEIVPDKNHRVCLKCYPYNDESSSYINAVQVDGFCSPDRFIVTQQPLPNTVGDFWRMVWERQSTLIISLNEINPNDKTSCYFWPENGSEMNPVEFLKISHISTNVLECYQVIKVHVVNKQESEKMEVSIVSMNNWMPKELLPKSIENFLLLWEECDVLSRKSETIIVTCYDGAMASGLYIAATFIIDKMKLEQECDVCLAVRTVRHNRKQFVTSEEQFKFLYKVAIMYIDGFQSYANFN